MTQLKMSDVDKRQKKEIETFRKGYGVPKAHGLAYNAFRGHFKPSCAYLAKAKVLLEEAEKPGANPFKADRAQKMAKIAINRGAPAPDSLLLYGNACISNRSYTKALEVARYLQDEGYPEKGDYLLGKAAFAEGMQHFKASEVEASPKYHRTFRELAIKNFNVAYENLNKITSSMDGVPDMLRTLRTMELG